MEKIKIIGDCLKADKLYALLKPEIAEMKGLDLMVEKTPENTLAFDPQVLMAVIGISQVALSALITGVFALLLKRQERGTAKQTSYIEVKIEKETVTLKAPVGASAEDIQRIVQAAQDALEKGKRIKHIAVIEEG